MLIELLIVIVVLGLIVGIAHRFMPEPFRTAAIAVAIVILIVWLLRLLPRF